MTEGTITREWEGIRLVLHLAGVFDRSSAWALRERMERETAPDLLVDFSQVRDFSDLGVAVLAHGLQSATRRVAFRGLRQHQLRIFRYCGLAVEEVASREVIAAGAGAAAAERRA